VKALRTINSNLVFNSSLPRNNASKVNVCQQVIKSLNDCGFRGDVSYSALMYPNEGDTRTLLMWLNQNVRISNVDEKKPESAKDVLQTSIALELKRQMKQSWAPLYFPSTASAKYSKMSKIDTVPIRSAYVNLFFL
jgi:hypothetical protein